MKLQNLKQGSQEWLDARKKLSITGSTVACLNGHNPFLTIEQLVRQKVRDRHGEVSEFVGNVATQWGNDHESEALLRYESETGNLVSSHGLFTHKDYEWIGYSPDGIVENNIPSLLEIKCPYSKQIPDLIPAHYMDQIQLGMHVLGLPSTDFFYWTPTDFAIYKVNIDDKWWDEMFPKMEAFHQLLKDEYDNPEHLKPLYVPLEGAEAEKAVKLWLEAKEQLQDAQEVEKELRDHLIQVAGNRSAKGFGVTITQATRKGSIPYAKIPEVAALDLESYRGEPTPYFTVKSGK